MSDRGKISRLFCEHWREKTPSSAARRALETIIPTSTKSAMPVDVQAAAKYVGIEQVVDSEMTDCDGLLSSTPSGTYIASLRKGQGNVRKRFTLAHEVGHAIIYQSIGHHSAAMDGQLRCRAGNADERDEERLCDLIAAELLMPRVQFGNVMEETGVCASTVPGIAQRFGVSLQAAGRRVAQILPYDIGIGLWATNEDGTRLIPKWYLTKKGTMSLEHVIAVGAPGSACFTDQVVRGWHWIPLHGQMDKYFVDVSPIRGTLKVWLLFAVFNDAAQHIITTISRGRPATTGTQISLMGDQE